MRRIDFRARAALCAILIVVVACGLAPGASPATTNLTVWVDTPAIGSSLKQRIVGFMQDNPDIQVTVFDQTGKIQNGDASIAIEALANSALTPDVVALTDTEFQLMSNKGDLLNLGPYVLQETGFDTSDFFPVAFEAFSDHGKQYAIPSEIVPWVIFYNQDLFAKAHVNPPVNGWSTSEFVQDAQYVQAGAQGKQEVAGFVTDPTQAILPFVESFGIQPPDTQDDPFANWLTDKRTIDAAQWFADLALRENVMPVDPGNRTTGLWFAGRAAMTAMFMDQRNQLPAYMQRDVFATPTALSTATPPPGWKFNWGVAPLPRAESQTTVFYASGYGIPQTSRNPDAAWLLIDYLTGHLPSRPDHAYVPARESLAYSKQFADLYPDTGRATYLQSVLVGHRLPDWPSAARLTPDDLTGMLDGTVRPSTSLQALRDRVQPVLQKSLSPTPTPNPNAITT
jgi:ABC-type glycerol-3-phosphate transport system substrate-binding protein